MFNKRSIARTNVRRDYSKINRKKYYSVLDLKNGYYHIRLDEKSSKYYTFSISFENYTFLILAFGLNVASELFI